jgi:hypothetical protein
MRHRDIWKVTISEEMGPWRLGNDYDRPIPRRIVEEKGVPRNLFGFAKGGGCGTSLRFGTLASLRRVMPPASYARFVEFHRRASKRRRLSLAWVWRAGAYWLFVLNTVLTLKGLTRGKNWLERRIPRAYKCSPFAPSYLFPWGVESLQQKYYSKVERPKLPAGA